MEQVTNQKEPQKSSLFGSKHSDAPAMPPPDVMESISGIFRRLKMLENNVSTMKATLQNLERNQLDTSRELQRDIKTLEAENDEEKIAIRDLKNTLKLVISELQGAAKSEDVKILQKYLNLWSPVQFVTASQVKKIVTDVLEEQKNAK